MSIFSAPKPLETFVAAQKTPIWALIDGVNCKDLARFARTDIGGGLYKSSGNNDPTYSPWLLKIEPYSSRIEDLALLPPDTHWGFLFSSHHGFQALRAHFRRFTMMWIDGRTDADDAPVYFRFYDPRVMMDCFDVLSPDHLAALLSPVDALALPLSPQLGARSGISPLAERAEFRGKVIATDCRELQKPDGEAGSFRISALEFRDFSRAQQSRASCKLARELQGLYPRENPSRLIDVSQRAPAAAAVYGLKSVKQVRIYAECMIRHGNDFDRRDSEARALLARRDYLAWRKADALSQWMSSVAQTVNNDLTQESWW